jgi:hypothetical protein
MVAAISGTGGYVPSLPRRAGGEAGVVLLAWLVSRLLPCSPLRISTEPPDSIFGPKVQITFRYEAY